MFEHEKHHDDAAVSVLRVASYQESFCLFTQASASSIVSHAVVRSNCGSICSMSYEAWRAKSCDHRDSGGCVVYACLVAGDSNFEAGTKNACVLVSLLKGGWQHKREN